MTHLRIKSRFRIGFVDPAFDDLFPVLAVLDLDMLIRQRIEFVAGEDIGMARQCRVVAGQGVGLFIGPQHIELLPQMAGQGHDQAEGIAQARVTLPLVPVSAAVVPGKGRSLQP